MSQVHTSPLLLLNLHDFRALFSFYIRYIWDDLTTFCRRYNPRRGARLCKTWDITAIETPLHLLGRSTRNMAWCKDFCLICERETRVEDGKPIPYCSQACRLADFDRRQHESLPGQKSSRPVPLQPSSSTMQYTTPGTRDTFSFPSPPLDYNNQFPQQRRSSITLSASTHFSRHNCNVQPPFSTQTRWSHRAQSDDGYFGKQPAPDRNQVQGLVDPLGYPVNLCPQTPCSDSTTSTDSNMTAIQNQNRNRNSFPTPSGSNHFLGYQSPQYTRKQIRRSPSSRSDYITSQPCELSAGGSSPCANTPFHRHDTYTCW